jgi:hypothetical protein
VKKIEKKRDRGTRVEWIIDLMADFVMATLTLRFSPNFAQNSK